MSVSALFFGHILPDRALVAAIFRLAVGGGGVWMGVGTSLLPRRWAWPGASILPAASCRPMP